MLQQLGGASDREAQLWAVTLLATIAIATLATSWLLFAQTRLRIAPEPGIGR